MKEMLFGSIFFGYWRERLLNLEYVHNTLADPGHNGTITARVTRTSYNDNDKQGDRVSKNDSQEKFSRYLEQGAEVQQTAVTAELLFGGASELGVSCSEEPGH